MKTFIVEISETNARLIKVKTVDEETAIRTVKDKYEKDEISLDGRHFEEVDFKII